MHFLKLGSRVFSFWSLSKLIKVVIGLLGALEFVG